MEQQKQRIRLDEVTLMRCILALLIVLMHAFTCYNGGWEAPAGYVGVPIYKWIQRISFAFTLEAFVFISGYLFAFQRITLKRTEGLRNLMINKLKRLILPSVIFSVIYFIIFNQYNGLGGMLYSIINGCGHMWYLPMLFWCFIGGWLLEQVKVKDIWKMVLLVILNLMAIYTFPLRLTSAATFMVYFYGGFVVYKHSGTIKGTITSKTVAWGWVLFAVVFAVLRPLRDVLFYADDASRLFKLTMLVSDNACQLVYASVGLMVFYCTAVYYTKYHQLKPFVRNISTCSFGIYLFQQFVLELLYYKTNFPAVVGPYWLPWLGFVLATILSYFLSSALLKTKIGKFLIG